MIIVSASLVSCGGNKTPKGEKAASASAVSDTVSAAVNVRPGKTPSQKVLVSKGVIKSDNEVKVYSRITGQLNEVRLIDGQHVRKGELLFSLEDEELKAKVDLCSAELAQAKLLMEDILIGQGYRKAHFDEVPANVMEIARIKSGSNVKEKELEIAVTRLDRAKIKSPLSGVVANVAPTSYAYVNPGETLCTIVDTRNLIVDFSVLETELRRFSIGTVVNVTSVAYSEQEHQARVRSIGSVVDNAGMVKVEAVLLDIENLLPGMTAIVRL